MKVLVYGVGGVGAFFGGLLVRGGADVHFVARGAQLEAITRTGIRIESSSLGTVQVPPVAASTSARDAGVVDLVLICVKTYQTAAMLDDLATAVGPRTVIVTLQNGVESDEEVAARFGRARVLPGIVYAGVTLERPGVVSHVAAGSLVFGTTSSAIDPRVMSSVAETLALTGRPVRVSDDIARERWVKLVWNAAFNPLSALTGLTPRALLDRPELRETLLAVMRETVAVGQASGVDVRDADIDAQMAWTENAAAIKTSMLVDRERHREMEVDALIGVIVRKGAAHGLATPVSRTVYALLVAMLSRPLHASSGQSVPPPIHGK